METVLEVRDLSVAIGSEQILDDVSMVLHRAEILALVGPNGAGKSVLLRAVLGLLPYRGEVRWRKGVRSGYVPQRFAVDRSLPGARS